MKKIVLLFTCFMMLFSFVLNSTHLSAEEFALDATYKVDTVWATAFQATVTVKNNTNKDTSSWNATFTLPENYTISPNASTGFTTNGQNVSYKNPVGKGVIAAGQSTTFKVLVVMPQGKPTILNNLSATGNGSTTTPPPTNVPVAPVLNTISSTTSGNYTVSWNSVANATVYLLQQDTTASFSNPQTVYKGASLSKAFSNQPAGTYYYRVLASNTKGPGPFSNIKNITVSPIVVPVAPVLNDISSTTSGNYTVSWNSVPNAVEYLLQQDTSSSFNNPQAVYFGSALSKSFSNQVDGTYYYRVLASNTKGKSPYSNIESISVSTIPTEPSTLGIEHSVWYITWTYWFTGPTYPLPAGKDVINLFVGKLTYGKDGKPTLGGFGGMQTSDEMRMFTAYCAAQNPPIAVKASVGGGGGSYDRCWDLLTADNVNAFAQGLVDFCHDHNFIGVDFDYELTGSSEQEALVGKLIKQFKTLDPELQSSLCCNAGFGPNYPWQKVVKNIFDAALISPGNCAVDRLYIMSYYDPIEAEKNWVLGWADWAITNYGFTPARISVGLNDFDSNAYDIDVFAAWAASQGFSTAHWAFNPADPK